jgi:DNA-binding CsgD family transcriptional regulator
MTAAPAGGSPLDPGTRSAYLFSDEGNGGLSAISLLCMVAFCSALVLIVMSLRLNPKAALNRAMAVLAFFYGLWALGDALVISAPSITTIHTFTPVSTIGYVYGMAAYLTLSLVFTGASLRRTLLLSIPIYAIATIEMLRAFTGNWVITGFRPSPWGNVGIPATDKTWSYLDIGLRVAVLAIASAAYLWSRARSHSRRYRSIALYMLLGLAATAVLGIFSVKVVWQLWGYPDPSVLLGMIGIGIDLYLIERYRFLSLDHPRIEREVIGAVEDAVMLFDARLIVIKANAGAHLELARKPGQLIGAEIASLFPESESIRSAWHVAVEGGEKETRTRCSFDGRELVMTLSPILDEFDDLVGGMAIVRRQDGLDAAVTAFGITARERSILLMLMQGITNKEIAEALFIAPNTVKNHVANIYQKTGAGTRVELFKLMLRKQIPSR